jgi:hypothetical protein
MTAKEFEAEMRKIRALLISLECLLNAAIDLEDDSQALASCIFLMGELTEQINATEAAFLSSGGATKERDILTEALEFYADGENHESAPGKQSRVAKDKGRKARAAFDKIAGLEDLPQDAEEDE